MFRKNFTNRLYKKKHAEKKMINNKKIRDREKYGVSNHKAGKNSWVKIYFPDCLSDQKIGDLCKNRMIFLKQLIGIGTNYEVS